VRIQCLGRLAGLAWNKQVKTTGESEAAGPTPLENGVVEAHHYDGDDKNLSPNGGVGRKDERVNHSATSIVGFAVSGEVSPMAPRKNRAAAA
jgi:hypothetical protein